MQGRPVRNIQNHPFLTNSNECPRATTEGSIGVASSFLTGGRTTGVACLVFTVCRFAAGAAPVFSFSLDPGEPAYAHISIRTKSGLIGTSYSPSHRLTN